MGLIAGVGDFGLTELREETLQYRNEAEVILESVENLENIGIFNASTGVATIGATTITLTATPPSGWLNGQEVETTVAGTIGFAGINFLSGSTLNIGDKLRKRDTQWERIPEANSVVISNLIDIVLGTPIDVDKSIKNNFLASNTWVEDAEVGVSLTARISNSSASRGNIIFGGSTQKVYLYNCRGKKLVCTGLNNTNVNSALSYALYSEKPTDGQNLDAWGNTYYISGGTTTNLSLLTIPTNVKCVGLSCQVENISDPLIITDTVVEYENGMKNITDEINLTEIDDTKKQVSGGEGDVYNNIMSKINYNANSYDKGLIANYRVATNGSTISQTSAGIVAIKISAGCKYLVEGLFTGANNVSAISTYSTDDFSLLSSFGSYFLSSYLAGANLVNQSKIITPTTAEKSLVLCISSISTLKIWEISQGSISNVFEYKTGGGNIMKKNFKFDKTLNSTNIPINNFYTEANFVEERFNSFTRLKTSTNKILYVSTLTGNDSNNGLSRNAPLLSINQANTLAEDYDSIIIERGSLFTTQQTVSKKIQIDSYGDITKDKPLFSNFKTVDTTTISNIADVSEITTLNKAYKLNGYTNVYVIKHTYPASVANRSVIQTFMNGSRLGWWNTYTDYPSSTALTTLETNASTGDMFCNAYNGSFGNAITAGDYYIYFSTTNTVQSSLIEITDLFQQNLIFTSNYIDCRGIAWRGNASTDGCNIPNGFYENVENRDFPRHGFLFNSVKMLSCTAISKSGANGFYFHSLFAELSLPSIAFIKCKSIGKNGFGGDAIAGHTTSGALSDYPYDAMYVSDFYAEGINSVIRNAGAKRAFWDNVTIKDCETVGNFDNVTATNVSGNCLFTKTGSEQYIFRRPTANNTGYLYNAKIDIVDSIGRTIYLLSDASVTNWGTFIVDSFNIRVLQKQSNRYLFNCTNIASVAKVTFKNGILFAKNLLNSDTVSYLNGIQTGFAEKGINLENVKLFAVKNNLSSELFLQNSFLNEEEYDTFEFVNYN